jgi:hypothetical protein
MWGTSSLVDKLPDDLGTAIDGTRITGRRSDFFTARKLAPDNLGLLQQNRHQPEMPESANYFRLLVRCGPKQTFRR